MIPDGSRRLRLLLHPPSSYVIQCLFHLTAIIT